MKGWIVAVIVATAGAPAHPFQSAAIPECKAAGDLAAVPGLPEASGLAVSRRTPGRLWSHNDSGEPVLFALDGRGVVTGRLRLTGASVEDWEALASGPCPEGSCLFVADIGDNEAGRQRVSVYRVPEPSGGEQTVEAKDVYHATYPDGAHDAEALLVTPDGTLVIVTKGETDPSAVYRFPQNLRSGETHTLERIGMPRDDRARGENEPVTDGAVSPDGAWAVLRTNSSLALYRTAELVQGRWREVRRLDLKTLGEPQGEGVAIGPDGSIYLAGEGGGRNRAGTLARLTCTALSSR